jgi:hypothetical protein
MYVLVALREGKAVEWVGGFASRRDARREARKLNSLPTHWRGADGKVYHRPYWDVAAGDMTLADPGRR